MSSIWNNRISVSIFGESHGPAVGVVIDNLPAGEHIDVEEVLNCMSRRAPKQDVTSTQRREKDFPQIMSGVLNNKTTGTPLCAFIANEDISSEDYSNLSSIARPGHADYTGAMRYHGFNDVRGGGHFSGRLTSPLVFAGAICAQILERRGIYTGAHIHSIHNIKDKVFNYTNISREELIRIRRKSFPVIDLKKGELMKQDIEKAKENLDSLGGVVECCTINVPAGIGSPIFDGLENSIAQLMFGIPAVKGIEFGAGFNAAKMLGSENNDEFYVNDNGHVLTKTNYHGGILGGISSGMPITLKVAFKPTPSIAKPQQTVDYSALKNETVNVNGRHDPCIVPRAVPCVEAAVNIAILSYMIDYPNF